MMEYSVELIHPLCNDRGAEVGYTESVETFLRVGTALKFAVDRLNAEPGRARIWEHEPHYRRLHAEFVVGLVRRLGETLQVLP